MDSKVRYQYTKIIEYILDNIRNEKYQDGKIESEHELVTIFHVSRMTVRQALSYLQQTGVIYTLPKKGSYVTKQINETKAEDVYGLNRGMEHLQGTTSSRPLLCSKEKVVDPSLLALNLHDSEQRVWHVIRIRCVNDSPVALEDGYFSARLIPELTTTILNGSLYQYLNDLHLYTGYYEQDINACLALERGKYLEVDSLAPLLRILQTTYLKNGDCIEYAYTYFRADRYTFTYSESL